MTKSCCAYNCSNRFQKANGISFHKFPFAKKEILKKWISAVRRENFVPNIHTYICSNHFTPDCFYKNRVSRRLLKEDAVPSIFDFPEHLKKELKSRKPPKLRSTDAEDAFPHSTSDNRVNEKISEATTTDHDYFIKDSPRKLKRKYERIIEEKEEEHYITLFLHLWVHPESPRNDEDSKETSVRIRYLMEKKLTSWFRKIPFKHIELHVFLVY